MGDSEKADPERFDSEKDDVSRTAAEATQPEESGPEGLQSPAVGIREDSAHLSPTLSRQRSLPWTEERLELDRQLELEKTKSKPISLSKSADGTILVDWYTTDDPENPQNWSQGKKMFVLMQICLYAFAMYGGSSIVSFASPPDAIPIYYVMAMTNADPQYVVGEGGVMERFGVSQAAAALGLSIRLPLLFSSSFASLQQWSTTMAVCWYFDFCKESYVALALRTALLLLEIW